MSATPGYIGGDIPSDLAGAVVGLNVKGRWGGEKALTTRPMARQASVLSSKIDAS